MVFLNWRDCQNPEAGGSEVYVETVARALAAGGNDVSLFAAAFPGAESEQAVGGVRVVRGGSKLTVYPTALRALAGGALGRPDVVVDVQNGIPFGSRLVSGVPTVVLVHHVHREQWPVVYGPVRSRIGWWAESRVAPRLYRGSQYVAVSEATRSELAGLGVDRGRIEVVRNGVQASPPRCALRSSTPRVLVLGRLVPHKQVEHVIRAAAALRAHVPGLRVSVVGDGWWRDEARAEASRVGAADIVEFHGFVDDATKQRELARAWVLAVPSLKEGWGLVVTEAAAHEVPSIAYRSAGGVTESIGHGESGLLVDGGEEGFTAALRRVLLDDGLRAALARGAAHRAAALSWQATADAFGEVLGRVIGRPVDVGRVTVESSLDPGDPSHTRRGRQVLDRPVQDWP
ncbi:MAG: glycosyltransferase family 4 protein [Candidatus Nanopelagicales bacterium]